MSYLVPGLRDIVPITNQNSTQIGSGPVGGAGFYANRPNSFNMPTVHAFCGISGAMPTPVTPFNSQPNQAASVPTTVMPWYQNNSWGPGIIRPAPSPIM